MVTIQIERPGSGVVLARLTGEFDLTAADELRSALEAALGEVEARQLILDMAGVTYIDSACLGVILGRYKKLSQRGGGVVLAAVPPLVKRIMEISGLFTIMPVYESSEAALTAVREGSINGKAV